MTTPLLSNWPYKWFCPFKPGTGTDSEPDVLDLIDPTWHHPQLAQLLVYLRNAPTTAVTDAPPHECFICGARLGNASIWHSDGTWLWPGDLDHYVSEHSVRLPQHFIEHIHARSFTPPKEIGVPEEMLPWPPL